MTPDPVTSPSDVAIGEKGRLLPVIARQALEEELESVCFDLPAGDWLREPRACFVTLTGDRGLRGCVGRLESTRPLLEEVRENAVSAAFRDPRFPPLDASELPRIAIEVSVLSPLEEVPVASEEEAIAALRPGIDGAVLDADGRRGTFLPQVWEKLPEPADFVRQLKRKAGLDPNSWPVGARLWRYTVEYWEESPTA
jgi:AmmeMemoRadiSam system protein A